MTPNSVREVLDSPKILTCICLLINLLISAQVTHAEDVQVKTETTKEPAKQAAPVVTKPPLLVKKTPPEPEIPKILNLDYDSQAESSIIPVLTKLGFATQLYFAPGERIEGCVADSVPCVFGGDSDGWFVLGKKGDSSITLKPGFGASDTNLLVTTNRYRYAFALRVLGDKTKQSSNWMITFVHPSAEQSPAEKNLAVLDERLNSQLRIKRNTNYSMQKLEGSDEIIPSQVWDDGRFTFIRIPNNRSIPAIFKVSSDNSESLVESHIENDLLVIHQVSPRWVLRLSKQVIGIWNESFDPDGIAPVNGTTIPGVARIAKEGAK